MYLHENSPEILVILGSNGEIDALDFKKLDISMSVHPEFSYQCNMFELIRYCSEGFWNSMFDCLLKEGRL